MSGGAERPCDRALRRPQRGVARVKPDVVHPRLLELREDLSARDSSPRRVAPRAAARRTRRGGVLQRLQHAWRGACVRWEGSPRLQLVLVLAGQEGRSLHERRPRPPPRADLRSPGRHCHSTLSLTVIGCHSLGIYILVVVLLSLLSFSVKMTVLPWARPSRARPAHPAARRACRRPPPPPPPPPARARRARPAARWHTWVRP